MQRITIGRYKPTPGGPFCDLPVAVESEGETIFDGWIEGMRDDGSTWIMFLDSTGDPTVFYPQREEDGGVIGEPINLAPDVS